MNFDESLEKLKERRDRQTIRRDWQAHGTSARSDHPAGPPCGIPRSLAL